ncbi:ABC transporter ATP-binding protein [Microbacterium album]|uniref:ABC transporter n=1 Tax=Microbacterium album TaxID=2053191 RepID=A0A917IF80_9MICO|nr:ABC transporter ATP-binding protein [Microbacterium album]GGH47355.1 ABC transporter [Microbacterium album]
MLVVDKLGKTYGTGATQYEAIDEISFEVRRGEFVCIVGPSGCGKTTLLKAMAGLHSPTRGVTRLNDRAVTGPPAEMAVVFQEYGRSLMPWLTVKDNVLLPLRSRKMSSAERKQRVAESLNSVGLGAAGEKYPWQLSGGMQQRVAIARALAYKPDILLMDEPFASVDAQTRGDLEDLILKVRDEFGVTIVLVTHDIDESVYLSDRIVVLTNAPTRVNEVIDVDLGKPRDQVETKELPAFAHLRAHVYRLIRHREAEQ